MIGIYVLWQKLNYFLTSAKATYWGVVTTIAPSWSVHCKYWTKDKCSSDVPGGAKLYNKFFYCQWLKNQDLPNLLILKIVELDHSS